MEAGDLPEEVLASERAFFDKEAADLTDEDLLIPPVTFERYRNARLNSLNIAKDALFAHMNPLAGKKVLDYGCGHGENSCLLAKLGAEVTAFDISPVAVAKARRRAERNGLDQGIDFSVRQAGKTGYAPHSYDALLGFGVLHHLHLIMTAVVEEIALLLKPRGTAYFVEPMANSRLLRWLRPWVPVKRYATKHERQLLDRDLEPLRRRFASVELSYYYAAERLHRIIGDWARRPLRRLDYHAQRTLPFLRPYYGDVLIIARCPEPNRSLSNASNRRGD